MLSNHNKPITNQSVLNAITAAINNHMSPMISDSNNKNKRKRVIERPYGESLTAIETLYKTQQKENKRKRQRNNSKNSTLRSNPTKGKNVTMSNRKK